MKIQLSPTKIIPDAITVWNQPGPEVDIVMDIHKLTFREGSVDEIYSFHVLEHLFIEETVPAMKNWYKCLKKEGKLYAITNDFEFVSRSFVGGDIPLEMINKQFSTPTQITRDLLVDLFAKGGFSPNLTVIWHESIKDKIEKREYELLIQGTKHE